MNFDRYYRENFRGGCETSEHCAAEARHEAAMEERTERPLLRDDPIFHAWCREYPEEWAAWQAEWAKELARGIKS